jgi:hypothetical protein
LAYSLRDQQDGGLGVGLAFLWLDPMILARILRNLSGGTLLVFAKDKRKSPCHFSLVTFVFISGTLRLEVTGLPGIAHPIG